MSPVGTGSESSPGRRNFLARVIVGTQAAIAAAITAVVGGAALAPSFMPGRRSWLRAAMVADLVDGAPTPVTLRIMRQDGYRQVVDRRVVYVRREAGSVIVLDSTCTHLGCRTKYDAAAKQFVCPCHGGVYDTNGAVVAGPPPAPLRRIEARIDGDHVVVRA